MNIQIDKITHALACYSIAVTVGHFTNWWLALLAAILIGVLKELYDLTTGRGSAEWGDILADFLGAVFGSAIIFI